MSNNTYTEEELQSKLQEQRYTLRFDKIEQTMVDLSGAMMAHQRKEEEQADRVLNEIHNATANTAQCELDIKEDINGIEANMISSIRQVETACYETFVQKKELKVYVAIIIFTVSLTTGSVAYMSNLSEEDSREAAQTEMLNKIQRMLTK